MARTSNSNRRKRKYGTRPGITDKNRKKRALHQESLVERTQALIGRRVRIRRKDGPAVGSVRDIISQGDDRYPKDVKRKGNYLAVDVDGGDNVVVSRSRSKVI